MSQTTGPYPLTDGANVQVAMPSAAPWESVVLSNLSPFLLSVQGGAGQLWLPPWTENVFPSPASHNPFTVSAQLPAGTTASSSAGSQLQATWYSPGETPSGAWPIPMIANAIEAAIAGLNFTDGALDVNVSLIEGVVPVVPALTIINQTVTNGTGGQQLANVPAQRGITCLAGANNTGIIGIGSSIASMPLGLDPGQWGPWMPVTNLDLLFMEGTNGDVLTCVVV
jgi:hypothetical protein